MQYKLASIALAALALATTLAQAQPQGRGDRDDQRGPPMQQRYENGRDGRWNDDRRVGNGRGPDGRGPPGQRRDGYDRDGYRRDGYARGGYDHRPYFERGGRMPGEYRSRQYVVDDWRGHRLSAPPRGYNWVQVGADYALVAIATGVIAQVLLNH